MAAPCSFLYCNTVCCKNLLLKLQAMIVRSRFSWPHSKPPICKNNWYCMGQRRGRGGLLHNGLRICSIFCHCQSYAYRRVHKHNPSKIESSTEVETLKKCKSIWKPISFIYISFKVCKKSSDCYVKQDEVISCKNIFQYYISIKGKGAVPSESCNTA